MNQYLKHYTKSELENMTTIRQSWDGSELKVDELGIRVWLNPSDNVPYDGHYTIETMDPISGKWEFENYYFDYNRSVEERHATPKHLYNRF